MAVESLKAIDELDIADPRSEGFAVLTDEGYRNKTLEDHYSIIQEISLHTGVPEKIRDHFETARNLLLYAWHVYRFIPVAEFHAAASLEFALREKTGKVRWGLKKLIRYAIDQGWVEDEGFSIHRKFVQMKHNERQMWKEFAKVTGDDINMEFHIPSYVEKLADSIPYLRNVVAHGSNSNGPGGYLKLLICAEFINQVYHEEI
ncbi:MAG: hypothetical protein ACJAW7_002406 [Candidatus Azotimanducaceae bacterium]|jgi:hypothetical protein